MSLSPKTIDYLKQKAFQKERTAFLFLCDLKKEKEQLQAEALALKKAIAKKWLDFKNLIVL